jgi:DNA mismatch endonuclease (patch repair protein)
VRRRWGIEKIKEAGVDNLSQAERSEIMGRVPSKNSRPELFVRRLVFSMGYRYRLHDRRLPGCPDLVFAGRGKIIFVQGCFWHRHHNCALARMPKSRIDFWEPKLEANKRRDRKNRRALVHEGWKVLTIWECEVGDWARLSARIRRFFDA